MKHSSGRPELRFRVVMSATVISLLWLGAGSVDAQVADIAMNGDVAGVRQALRDGADVNLPQGDGMTALHWAAENGHTEVAKVLVLSLIQILRNRTKDK